MSETDIRKLSLKEFFLVEKWILLFYFKITPLYVSLYIISSIYLQFTSIISTFIFSIFVTRVVEGALTRTFQLETYIPLLLLLLTDKILAGAASEVFGYVDSMLNQKANPEVSRALARKLTTLGILTLEDPEFSNKLERVKGILSNAQYFLYRTINFISRIFVLLSSGAIIVTYFPWAIPIMIIISLPSYFIDQKYIQEDWNLFKRLTEERRRAYSLIDMLHSPKELQEITITNSSEFITKKFNSFADNFFVLRQQLFKPWFTLSFITSQMSNIALTGGYLFIIRNFVLGVIDIGTLTFQVRNLDIFLSTLSTINQNYQGLRENAARYIEMKEIFETESNFKEGEFLIPENGSAPEIEFKNISFKYPQSKRSVIKNLSLKIGKGEKVAIVGKNGAGKSTLIKLISRFYEVNKGELLINNTNINSIKSESLYSEMGVLHQDFVRYEHMNLRDNVIIGAPGQEFDQKRFEDALNSSDASEFVNAFPDKYEQILSERYKGGIRPSTGQWQKIALARFFYRNSPLVIFDEPTAAIDAESEYNIFNRIYEFFKDKTVIIISHRFSTVRNADRIIVFEEGQVVEDGSHEELMKLDGHYAKAFKLQAEGYK